jgi:hypothetical protein
MNFFKKHKGFINQRCPTPINIHCWWIKYYYGGSSRGLHVHLSIFYLQLLYRSKQSVTRILEQVQYLKARYTEVN